MLPRLLACTLAAITLVSTLAIDQGDGGAGDGMPCYSGIRVPPIPEGGTAQCPNTIVSSEKVVDCPDVMIDKGGLYGTSTGYCESYTFNPGLGHPHNLCLLIWSQCQAEPSQHKPSFQMQCEEAQKFAVPEAYPEAAVAGKSFDAGEKRCCRSTAANGLPCNSGIDSWMGISYEALENIGAALVVAACFCLCCIKMCFHPTSRPDAYIPIKATRVDEVRVVSP